MGFELADVWAALIAFAILAYVVLDGFDLGIGILFPFGTSEADRDRMMSTVAPVWDGNESWLVFGGGGLMAAFPLAYAVVMPALYIPFNIMLVGLVLRGVAFEFSHRSTRRKWVWHAAFSGGSLAASAMQGIALGTIIQGIPVTDRSFSGGAFDWFTPFPMLTCVALVAGYALLGASWIVLKTDGDLAASARHWTAITCWLTLCMIGAVSLATPFQDPVYWQRWFAWPTMVLSGLVPMLVIACACLVFVGLRQKRDYLPFLAAISIFILSFAGIGISFYPNILPPALTIDAAAAPETSLKFMFYGAVVLVPVILAYTAYSYWVFRGKVPQDSGYS